MRFVVVLCFLCCVRFLAEANAPVSNHDHTKEETSSREELFTSSTILRTGEDIPQPDEGPVVIPVSSFYGDARQQPHHKIIDESSDPDHKRMKVASFRPSYVATPLIIAAWVIIAGLTKIGFHVTPKISLICPESCLLIVVGVIIGLLLFYAGLSNVGPLTPNIFFLYMLPPIVLDAGYFMPNRPFFDNLVTILMFAVLGTVLNALSVGVSLWAVGLTGLYGVEMPLLNTLLFSSIACAVDPIAVLAVFEEIHVNEVLYILVFGESLLNDAVTVVLYHMFEGYTEMGPENIITVDYVAGVASFFVVAIGGTVVGIIWGLLAAFVSRFTHHVRVIEPLFVFVMSYLSYVSAELFHFSGILSLTFCGITMKNYVEENISYKSHVTVKYAMKMLASSSETIIFLFLGVSTVNDSHEWNTWFVIMTLLFCTVYRAIGVVFLSGLANRFRLHRINGVEQFIMAYGGLRGAVAFALVLIVSDQIIPTKNMMVTTIIALVFFTVFLQGMTIGPLVRILNVPKSNKMKLSMNERILTRSMDHLMAAIEDIIGQKMGNYHLRDKFKYYNNKYIRPLLTRDHANAEPKIFETYSKLNLADAMDLVKRNNSGLLQPSITGAASFSSIFRSYTLNNFENSVNDADQKKFEKSGLPRNNSSFLNVDIGELEYSPSHKDLADAELHHILADAMSKQPRRHRLSRGQLDMKESKSGYRHHWRQQQNRYFSHRRHSSLDHYKHNSTERKRKDFICKSNNLMPPPPELRFSLADDEKIAKSENQVENAGDDPVSTHSSYLDLSSSASHDDECIYFVAQDNFPQTDGDSKDNAPDDNGSMCEPSGEDTNFDTPQKTLTESTLPWKRLGEEVLEDNYCLRAWNATRAYSMDNTPYHYSFDNRRFSAPLTQPMMTNSNNNDCNDNENRPYCLCMENQQALPECDVELEDISGSKITDQALTTLQARPNDKVDSDNHHQTKDVIIDLMPNGNAMPLQNHSNDEGRSQATRL